MKKTITLDSKLKKYGSLACGIVGATAASAQVVYTDVNPDMVLTTAGTAQGAVDLNNDATVELAFGVFESIGVTGTYSGVDYTGTQYAGVVVGTAGKSWMGSNSTSMSPIKLAPGNTIGAGGSFSSSQGSLGNDGQVAFGAPYNVTYPLSGGEFLGTEGYLGARFDISGSTHYGWVRVEMSADGKTLTIKDYAYEASPGVAIAAGDLGGGSTVGVDDISSEVVIRTVNNNLRIELENTVNAEVAVTNLAGQKVINEQMNDSYKVINLDEMTTGIYLVNVTTDAGTVTKKIYVK